MKFLSRPANDLARLTLPLLAVAVAAGLSGCGGGKAGSEAAAKVNKDEISVAQVNFLLAQQRGLRPDQADQAAHQILDRLVDQQLAIQKAAELKLESEPGVQIALELARREVLGRAYLERTGEAAAKPTPEDVQKYYNERPAMFSARRIYNLQEMAIEARPEQMTELRERLSAAKSINEFVEYLKASGLKFAANQAVRAAEQLPANSLQSLANLKDGQAMLVPTPNGAQVVVLAGSRDQPLTLEQARPAIEQMLLAERRRKLVEDDVKALRAAAKIEYLGKFAASSASSPAPAASGNAGKGPDNK